MFDKAANPASMAAGAPGAACSDPRAEGSLSKVGQAAGTGGGPSAGPASGTPAAEELVRQVRGLQARLVDPPRTMTDAERVDALRALEELKNTACAAQALISVDLDASQRAAQAAVGVPARAQGRGVAGQVGLARRDSAHRGARHLGLGKVLVGEMPCTLAGMRDGWLSEWRATLLAKETACLSAEHRAVVDQTLAGDRAGELQRWSDRRLVAEAARMAYRLDPQAVLRRIRRVENDRCVTSRPAPDTMAYLSALLPAARAVACYAALAKAADTARAQGDSRSRGQVMADTLVELLTGQKTADATPVEIGLVVTDRTLFANLGQPGYGVVPAGWARDLVAGLPAGTRAWIRRLYRHSLTGQLVAMDSKRRAFRDSIRRFTVLRDQICRTPWCGAPIRHVDHPVPVAEGGDTSSLNSQGLCEACNYAKQAPGWSARPVPGPVHTVRTTTPTGHVYDSTAPPPPGAPGALPGVDPPERSAADGVVPVDPMDDREREALFEHLLTQYAA